MIYKIKGKRAELGWTQKELANKLGITSPYMSKIEKRIAYPPLLLARKISLLLNSNIEELFFQE